jgi:signal transduction histidine kinase
MSELGKLEAREIAHLDALIGEMAAGLQEGEDRGVRLDVRAAGRPLHITGDRHRLSTALKWLIHSALRERGQPGVVVVESSIRGTAPAWGVVAIGDESVLPSLTQAATGTPPAFDEWRGGLGLALPVARRVIEAHGGALWSAIEGQPRAASALRLPLRS